MITRYIRPEMGQIWSEENKYKTWWKVELEVCRVQHERGLIPTETFREIESGRLSRSNVFWRLKNKLNMM
jgi:adenylosuccinate lyase